MQTRIVSSEFTRLSRLYRCGVLDTPSDPAFDGVLADLAQACEAPIAQLVFADARRFWAKAGVGAIDPESPRERGLLERMVTGGPAFMHDDGQSPPEDQDSALPGVPPVRSFAGLRIVSPEDEVLGVLYVADRVPRSFAAAAERLAAAALAIEALLTQGRRARQDGSTGALDHDAFLDQSRRLMAVSRPGRQWVSLVTLDLAPLRAALEERSRGLGSLALRQMADLGRTQVRQRDCFGRTGADSFAILLTDTAEAGARVLSDRLARRLEQGWGQAGLGLSGLTLGLASAKPTGIPGELDILLSRAAADARVVSAAPPAVPRVA
ncbi:diguanylate cyclase [Lichenihabitans sp. Uapishka_5]|uniref:GGDEF domain-containing protein n=1 Tax=Lichenihabitans sp. Uapishka_5 TaxID=3037302 RepID=UPI0029E805AC|nr:diguanylate cyclase [Lichenihabitans sp. Uapishka_5]MDX7950063.1 diguanylate cyclase [Lichenihabitans sp. Uapishka_5]